MNNGREAKRALDVMHRGRMPAPLTPAARAKLAERTAVLAKLVWALRERRDEEARGIVRPRVERTAEQGTPFRTGAPDERIKDLSGRLSLRKRPLRSHAGSRQSHGLQLLDLFQGGSAARVHARYELQAAERRGRAHRLPIRQEAPAPPLLQGVRHPLLRQGYRAGWRGDALHQHPLPRRRRSSFVRVTHFDGKSR